MPADLLRHFLFLLLLAAVMLPATPPAQAGGPLALMESGRPFLWPGGGAAIPWNPDRGGLGPLDHTAAVALTHAAFHAWQSVPSAAATYINQGDLPVDVDITNFFPFLFSTDPDGLSAIVYDQDGSIFRLLFGARSGVVGFSGPEFVDAATGDIVEGVAFLNGGAILAGLPEFDAVEVHEFGHFSNLAHSAVNGQVALGDSTGPTPHNSFARVSLLDKIETMYPFLLIGGGQASPDADDIAALSTLYPAPGFSSATGAISGSILDQDGTTRLSGVNVIARNISRPFDDAYSVLSGDQTDDPSQADPLAGTYTLNGLTPGATYAIFVDAIFAGGFSTPPLTPLPNVEEFYNGASESFDPLLDDPSVFTGVTVVAGSPVTGSDIIFNRFSPRESLPFRDDSSVQLFLPFSFKFCGKKYRKVFVNANGNLTFGRSDSSFAESVAWMLAGPPRLAGLWNDFSPQMRGRVIFTQGKKSFTVSFMDVPQFPNTGANSFSMELLQSPPRVAFSYTALTATDGLVGFSCGGEVTNGREPETDISQLGPEDSLMDTQRRTAVYELFIHDNDLAGREIGFTAPKDRFRDEDEPNNTALQAVPVALPFTSAQRFTTIHCASDDDTDSDSTSCTPAGGDVDFFIFQAQAGATLLAQTVPGNPLDTVLGLYRVEGFTPGPTVANHSTVLTSSSPLAAGQALSILEDGIHTPGRRGRRPLQASRDHDPLRELRSRRPRRLQRALNVELTAMTTPGVATLLATDDDSGIGRLSRIIFPVAQSGTFAVAVSTFPDLAFEGAGETTGRYILDLQTLDGEPLFLGDDTSQQVAIAQFSFPYQGKNWSSVFVNSNGNLTFGRGDVVFLESVARFLKGPPRIAPLWSDLNPEQGGMALINQDSQAFTVRYMQIPAFMSSQGNTFKVTLHRNGTITMEYGPLSVESALVGITQGKRAIDPGPVDLSAAAGLPATGTHYQQFFSAGELDLAGLTLVFTGAP
ncbi:MAG: hypothetical protein ACE5ID_00525 [Acidobacteriota bacterium]